jgi:hypothetical protein
LAHHPLRWQQYNAARTHHIDLLNGQRKGLAKSGRSELSLPEGLDKDVVARLRAVIEPDHPENPFTPGVRFRNYMIIRLLLDLGIRRGSCSVSRSKILNSIEGYANHSPQAG